MSDEACEDYCEVVREVKATIEREVASGEVTLVNMTYLQKSSGLACGCAIGVMAKAAVGDFEEAQREVASRAQDACILPRDAAIDMIREKFPQLTVDDLRALEAGFEDFSPGHHSDTPRAHEFRRLGEYVREHLVEPQNTRIARITRYNAGHPAGLGPIRKETT